MNNPYLKSLMAVMMFLVIQGLGGIATTAAGLQNSITALAFTVILCGLACCLLLAGTRMVRLQEAFRPSPVSWRMAGTALLGFLTGVVGLALLSEQLDLPDMMEDQFVGLSHNPWGILSVCLAGPVLEELFFREGIQGHIQRAGGKPVMAILVSGLLFGLIHLNPAQVPFAACIGILLGIVYHKTGHNILLCSLLHILNNTVSIIELRVLGEEARTFRMDALLGGPAVAIVLMVLCLAACMTLYARLWRMQEAD